MLVAVVHQGTIDFIKCLLISHAVGYACLSNILCAKTIKENSLKLATKKFLIMW